MTPISFFVPGVPVPGGSKTATVVRRKGGEIVMVNGRPLVTTRDDAKGNKEWKSLVAYIARQQYRGDPLEVPLEVDFVFVMPRLKSHFGSGKNAGQVKATAPHFHTVKPDCTKLIRAAEDALTGILWRDDACIARQSAMKTYGAKTGLQITVRSAFAQVPADPPAEAPAAAQLFAERRIA